VAANSPALIQPATTRRIHTMFDLLQLGLELRRLGCPNPIVHLRFIRVHHDPLMPCAWDKHETYPPIPLSTAAMRRILYEVDAIHD
jgi:hypothetical protein